MAGPLDGVRIVDLTMMVSGPMATMILADQGADVIKVERPAGGDHTRQVSNARGGVSVSFLNNNRNKRSIALDLKDRRGLEALKRIAAGADVFVQNFRPGVVERMGVGEDAIRAVAPEIVYVSICGFGHRGPYAGKPVYDPLIQAVSGLATIQGGSDARRPRLVRTIVPDKLTAVTASQAITAALFARQRTGKGQHVRLSMLDAMVAFLWASDMSSQTLVGDEPPQETAHSFIDLIYETADGHISVAVQSDREWAALCRAVDRPEWLEDVRFGSPADRHANIDDRLSLTQEVLRANGSAHWLAVLEAHDVPCAPVLKRRDLEGHPQIQANELIRIFEHDEAGPVRQARPAAEFSATPPEYRRGGPPLGKDTDAVLAEAGFSPGEIAGLRADGVAGAGR